MHHVKCIVAAKKSARRSCRYFTVYESANMGSKSIARSPSCAMAPSNSGGTVLQRSTNTGRYPLMCAILPLMLYAENHFVSPTQGVLNFETVVQEISAFMESEHGRSYKLIVGTDSSASAGSAQFVSVIIIHRIGTCARYFW